MKSHRSSKNKARIPDQRLHPIKVGKSVLELEETQWACETEWNSNNYKIECAKASNQTRSLKINEWMINVTLL